MPTLKGFSQSVGYYLTHRIEESKKKLNVIRHYPVAVWDVIILSSAASRLLWSSCTTR